MAVARVSEIVASSPKGYAEATAEGVKRASKTLRGITGVEVLRQSAKVESGKITEYRVHLNVTFLLDD